MLKEVEAATHLPVPQPASATGPIADFAARSGTAHSWRPAQWGGLNKACCAEKNLPSPANPLWHAPKHGYGDLLFPHVRLGGWSEQAADLHGQS
nr:hypothetical protein Iba_chr12aCG7660 [Ipomoea batatas]